MHAKDHFLNDFYIQVASFSNKPRKRPSERVKRLKYGESLTSEECLKRMEDEDREKKRKEAEKVKKSQQKGSKKKKQRKQLTKSKTNLERCNSDSDNDSEEQLEHLNDIDNDNRTDEVEKCEICGKIDDSTNSDQFIGCDLCPSWYCKSVGCSGIDLTCPMYLLSILCAENVKAKCELVKSDRGYYRCTNMF